MSADKARFIAGATCPACKKQDVIKALPHRAWWCVDCGHSESSSDKQGATENKIDAEQNIVRWKDDI